MPTYEYACSACGNEWEQTQRITEPPVELCPKCAASAAHRLISGGTNFILKGGGWYSDLYASPKPPAKEAKEGTAETGSKSDGKPDAKPDTKPDAKPAAASSGSATPAAASPSATSSPSTP